MFQNQAFHHIIISPCTLDVPDQPRRFRVSAESSYWEKAKATSFVMVLKFRVVAVTLSLRSKYLLLNLESLCFVAYSVYIVLFTYNTGQVKNQ